MCICCPISDGLCTSQPIFVVNDVMLLYFPCCIHCIFIVYFDISSDITEKNYANKPNKHYLLIKVLITNLLFMMYFLIKDGLILLLRAVSHWNEWSGQKTNGSRLNGVVKSVTWIYKVITAPQKQIKHIKSVYMFLECIITIQFQFCALLPICKTDTSDLYIIVCVQTRNLWFHPTSCHLAFL